MRPHLLPLALLMTTARGTSTHPKALVYRGPAACDGCPEAVAQLLESSPWRFKIVYVGPKEDADLDENSLKGVDVYAQAGGPDLDDAYRRLKGYTTPLRKFVSSGGHYLGFCLGAFLAGHSPGFGLLPPNADTDAEISQPGSQVTSDKDTIIQVDWTFASGKTRKDRWLYFQDGAVITGLDGNHSDSQSGREGRILARYSTSGDIAASVTPYGNGWVGLVGPHPEATQDWYSAYNLTNPNGISFDVGYDFINATFKNQRRDNTTTRDSSKPSSPTPVYTSGGVSSSTSIGAGAVPTNPIARVISLTIGGFWRD